MHHLPYDANWLVAAALLTAIEHDVSADARRRPWVHASQLNYCLILHHVLCRPAKKHMQQ
jgi:hypothetical protein